MDHGIWATWYDLPDGSREEYLDWLHSSYLPRMAARPGYLWATHIENVDSEEREAFSARVLTHTDDPDVPDGFHYLLLFGAPTAHTFVDPAPEELLEELSAEDRRMLGLRTGVRDVIFTEIARVESTASHTRHPGITPGPVIQFGTFNLQDWQQEAELSTWYSRLTFPLVRPVEGMVGARRLVSISGFPRHGVLYEYEDMEAAQRFFDVQGANRQPWNMKVVGNLIHAPHSPTLGSRTWPVEP